MDNILRLSCHEDPITLDPQKSGDKLSSTIIFLLFKGLTRLGTDQTIHCDLADSFHTLDNYKKYVFRLGEHFWSDNTPITAHDFVYSWKRAISPGFPARAANFFFHIKNAEKAKRGQLSLDKVSVSAESDRELVVELEYPCPYFPELTSFCPLFPVPSQANIDKIPSVFSGAFQLQYWNERQEILLRKNSLCKNPTQLDAIHIKIIPDEKEAFALFENDQLDWIGDPISPLPVAYLTQLAPYPPLGA
jgi:oligopeptide transport system substrate-binding protein